MSVGLAMSGSSISAWDVALRLWKAVIRGVGRTACKRGLAEVTIRRDSIIGSLGNSGFTRSMRRSRTEVGHSLSLGTTYLLTPCLIRPKLGSLNRPARHFSSSCSESDRKSGILRYVASMICNFHTNTFKLSELIL